MRFALTTTSDGVCEQDFTLDDIPGVLWSPAGAAGRRPLVLLGHGGGGGHTRAPGVLARARRLVTGCGFAAAAIDMPGFGDRPKTAEDERFVAEIRATRAAGEPIGPLVARYNAVLAERAVPEWQATLDALQALDVVGPDGPVGYWGVSLGTRIGVPLAAAEPRITAAVFGLAGGTRRRAGSRSRSSSCCSGTTSWCRAPTAWPCSTRSARPARPCTPTPAATARSPRSNSTAPSASSPATSVHRGDRGSLLVSWQQ